MIIIDAGYAEPVLLCFSQAHMPISEMQGCQKRASSHDVGPTLSAQVLTVDMLTPDKRGLQSS